MPNNVKTLVVERGEKEDAIRLFIVTGRRRSSPLTLYAPRGNRGGGPYKIVQRIISEELWRLPLIPCLPLNQAAGLHGGDNTRPCAPVQFLMRELQRRNGIQKIGAKRGRRDYKPLFKAVQVPPGVFD
jgi:hypothetical protein